MRKGYLKFLLPIVMVIVVLAVVAGCNGTSTTTTTRPPGTTTTGTTLQPPPTTTSRTTTTTQAPPTKDKILIGMSRPLSGPLAIIGDSAFKPIYDKFKQVVNADGGIYVAEYGKKLPIDYLIYDDKSDVATTTRLTEKLILEDKVDFLWPASGTSFLFAQAPIANKYNYILVTAEGGATSLRDMLPSLPYIFVSLSFSDWYQMPVFADLMAAKQVKSAYIMYISDLHGIEYNSVAGIELGRVGVQILGTKAVPPDIQDLSPIIKEAMASGADAFMAMAYPDQVMPAVGTSIELGYNPKVWIGGPAVNFGFFHDAFGPAVEGIMGWTTFARKSSPELAAFADMLYEGLPETANDWWGHPLYWGAYEFWKQAIVTAGTLDQTKIRQVMATSHFQTILGDTFFTNGLLDKSSHPGEVGQWINGIYEVVGPVPKSTADLVYPKPAWPAP
jgi:branched-chain amino acid transport system substrate-binding protein